MGGPGSGRRPAVILREDHVQQKHEFDYKDIIYPLVSVNGIYIGSIISSKQEENGTQYETYALCEFAEAIEDKYVRLIMTRYEPYSDGLLGSIKTVFGVIEEVGDTVKDGRVLTLIRLLDEVNYDEVYEIYTYNKFGPIRPLQEVFSIKLAGRGVFYTTKSIINDVNFPIGVTVSPKPEKNESSLIVGIFDNIPVLLGIWPRWSWQEVLEFVRRGRHVL